MKQLALILAGLFAFGCGLGSTDSTSKTMGYSITVPDNWISLSGEEIRDNPDLFDASEIPMASPEFQGMVRQQLTAGKADFYFRQSDTPTEFADNVNVIKQIQEMLQTQSDLDQVCNSFPGELNKAFGSEIAIQACEFRKIVGKNALYVEFDGPVRDTRVLQYQVPRSKSITLIVTATASLGTLSAVRAEFEEMMASFQLE